MKAQLNVDFGPKITARINDLAPTFGNIIVNQATDSDQATNQEINNDYLLFFLFHYI